MNTIPEEQASSIAADATPNPQRHPLTPLPLGQRAKNDDDLDNIFLNAVAEIDTQPLPRRTPLLRWQEVVQTLLCVGLMLGSTGGIVWQALTYPTMLVILYTVEHPAQLTTWLDIPTRPLAAATLTRSLATPTTGHGHQDARAAMGLLTFYNGNASPQTVASGTVLTGADGIQVVTEQSVTIPAASPPTFGQISIPATTRQTGSRSNIAPGDINGTVSSSLFVKNLNAFGGGRDARTFQAVAQTDVDTVTTQVKQTLAQAFQAAFVVRPNEQAHLSNCQTTTTATHRVGEEAQTVTLTSSETCGAIAYDRATFAQRARHLFTAQTAPDKHYTLLGSLSATVVRVTPLTVRLAGVWGYVFSSQDKQALAQAIEGKTPAQARTYLLHREGIVQASIPATLPPASYIHFVVLVGQQGEE